MYDTDAAGILYFANQFRFAHDAFESLMASEGLNFQQMFEVEPFLFVIVHAESDYKISLKVGDPITVRTWIENIGTTSFSIAYHIYKNDEILVGTAKTVHVCIDKHTREKTPIPEKPLGFLRKYLAPTL